MKHTILLFTLCMSAALMAQEGPKISTAIIDFDRSHDTVSAKQHIKEAAEIIANKDLSTVKSKDLAKFYLYRGKINFAIANSAKAATRALEPNALQIASESFTKLLDYEKSLGKERYSDEARNFLPYVANSYARKGIEASNAKDFQKAYEDFLKTYELKKQFKLGTDTAMLYNAALMAQNAKNYEKALDLTKQLIDMNYRGVQYKATEVESGKEVEFASKRELDFAVKSGGYKDPRVEGDVRPDLYITAANFYKTAGDTTQYNTMVSEGRKLFPGNKSLLLAELQTYLDNKEYDKAMVNLDQAIAKEPTNKLYYYLKGYIYQTQMDEPDKAMDAYDKAIEADSAYLDPMYMKGLIYVDKANAITQEMNNLKLNETTKYNKLQKEQNEAFKKALPYFEKAREINPTDMDTLKALKEVYYKLKMYDKAKEVQNEIDNLQ